MRRIAVVARGNGGALRANGDLYVYEGSGFMRTAATPPAVSATASASHLLVEDLHDSLCSGLPASIEFAGLGVVASFAQLWRAAARGGLRLAPVPIFSVVPTYAALPPHLHVGATVPPCSLDFDRALRALVEWRERELTGGADHHGSS